VDVGTAVGVDVGKDVVDAAVGARVVGGVAGATVVHSGRGEHDLVTVVAVGELTVSSMDEMANIPPSMIVMLSPPLTGNAISYLLLTSDACICWLNDVASHVYNARWH